VSTPPLSETIPGSTAPPGPGWGKWRLAAGAAFAVGAVCVLYDLANRGVPAPGDCWEHWLIAESFHRHGTPDLHDEDVPPVYAEARRVGHEPPPHPYAYEPAPDGHRYGVHFWGYALCGVPAKVCLNRLGKSELLWPQVSNAVWLILAVGIVLFVSNRPVGERLALAGLAVAGPGYVYLGWSGPEAYSWAFALVAASMYRDRRYGWSGLAAGLSALQNPPIIVFGAFAVLAALWERRPWTATAAGLGTAAGLFPFAFFYYHFGKPNLIARDFVRLDYIAWVRTWSQFTDFDQGLLPYAPLLVFGLVFVAVRFVYTRDVRGLLFLAGALAVAVGTQVSRNWNSGCDGLQRYMVWVLPLVAGAVVAGLGSGRALRVFSAAGVVLHFALVPIYRETGVLGPSYLDHTKMAEWVLTHHPKLYRIEPEIFVERTRREDNWPLSPVPLPVAHVRPDGTVSKMLIDSRSIDRAAEVYEIDPSYLEELRADAARRPLVPRDPYYFPTWPGTPDPPPDRLYANPYFVHPPHGAVRLRQPRSP
jgi:hypothetical protein